MKMPVSPLGMTNAERADFHTGKYPERTIETPDPSPPTTPDLSAVKEFGAAIRDYWRLDGKIEGRREGLAEGIEKGKLEGKQEGRIEGREEVLREKLTEALQATKDATEASSHRGVGRPEGRLTAERDADAMAEIRKNYPRRDFVRLFKDSVKTDHPGMHPTSVNRRAREAKKLLDDWDLSKK
jgi:hypothetical protein